MLNPFKPPHQTGPISIIALRASSDTLRRRSEAINDAVDVDRSTVDGLHTLYQQHRLAAQADAQALDTHEAESAKYPAASNAATEKRLREKAAYSGDKLKRTKAQLDNANAALRAKNATAEAVHAAEVAAAASGGADLVALKVPKNATSDGLQAARLPLINEREKVLEALPPRDDLRSQILAHVKATAKAPVLIVRGGEISVRYPIESAGAPTNGGLMPNVSSASALLCWAMPDAIVAALTAQLDAKYEGKLALSGAEKAARLAALDSQLLDLDRIEAELTWLKIEAGESAWFRPGLSAKAILGIA